MLGSLQMKSSSPAFPSVTFLIAFVSQPHMFMHVIYLFCEILQHIFHTVILKSLSRSPTIWVSSGSASVYLLFLSYCVFLVGQTFCVEAQ